MMRRLIAFFVILILLSSFFLSGCLFESTDEGFTRDDLKTPKILYISNPPTSFPSPLTDSTPTYSYTLRWTMSSVYAGYGGVMSLEIENKGTTALFIYGYGLKWVNYTEEYFRSSSVYVYPGETESLGMLAFRAPSVPQYQMYTIMLKLCVSNPSINKWHDYGTVDSGDRLAEIKPLKDPRDYSIQKNIKNYYSKVNSLVNVSAVESVVEEIRTSQPGNYSTLQIAEAFDWVRSHITYKSDDGGDYWQSANETLQKRTGDCEDQAILLASIITALGGNARVSIIEGHAFASVFITSDGYQLPRVQQSLRSFYGTNITMHVLSDDLGYWLVVDTTGSMYAGGLPANASPTSAALWDNWTFESTDWLIQIDVISGAN
ncbi:MAG: transglutaminase domain-containing protein [Methanomassiliicoccales archaeon]|nr:transglutaminase domain-containing protein [Methanomassiliicoccales archaeon]